MPALGEPHLSVVVPVHDEAERIETAVRRIVGFLDERRIDSEVLVVDDGSTDGTLEAARRALADRRGRVLHVAERRGEGAAVRHGVAQAAGRWVVLTDAAQTTPIEEYGRLADVARERDRDVVIGSRAVRGSAAEVERGVARATLGRTFNVLARVTTGIPFRDTQCRFKLLDRKRTKPLFDRMVVDSLAWDVELLFLCVRFGLRVEEVRVPWRNDARTAPRLFVDPPRMLFDLLRVRWRFRSGAYNP